jgi:hypothetical protein
MACFAIGSFVFANLQSNPSASSGQAIEQSENKIVEQLSDEPQILSISANPGKVKVGDILFITAEIKDANGIEKASAIMPHDNGADEIQLFLISGDNKSGKWQAQWQCYDTINKEYITTVTAINVLGKNATGEVAWWDDTETVWWHGEGWLSGWTKRKKIAVAGSTAGAQTNYQVEVTVAYDSDMQADFDDIRFTKSDGSTALDFWLESKTNSVTADFWVEVDSIPASPSTVDIHMYYGNTSASSASNGVNTFLFFDDFKTNTIATKWQVVSGTWSIDTVNERLVSDSTGDTFVKANFSEPNDWIIDVDTYFTNDNNWGSIIGRFQDTNNLYACQLCLGGGADAISIVEVVGGSWTYLTGAYLEKDYALSTWYHSKFKASGSNFDIWEGATHLSGSDSTLSSGDVGLHGGNDGATAYDIYFKTYRVRKYASTEPSVGTAGSEEYMSDWPYRKKITLSSATGLANYQVKVDLTTAIMGNPYTNVQTDGDDIRFCEADGTLLDYWIEAWSATGDSKLWVEVASSSTSVIYMYYGNPSANSASSGINTFLFFEDFNRANSGTVGNGWTEHYDASFEISANQLKGTWITGHPTVGCLKAFTADTYIYQTRMKVPQTNATEYFIVYGEVDNRQFGAYFNNSGSTLHAFDTTYATIGTYAADTWYDIIVTYHKTAGTFDVSVTGMGSQSGLTPQNHTSHSHIVYYTGSETGIFYADHVFVREYAATEPTATVVTDEEKRSSAPGFSPHGGGAMMF